MRRKADRVRSGKMPADVKQRWQKALDQAAADRESIEAQGRAVFAAHDSAREVVARLKAERERRGLSLADMLKRTGMSREALSRLENNKSQNPTIRTLRGRAGAGAPPGDVASTGLISSVVCHLEKFGL